MEPSFVPGYINILLGFEFVKLSSFGEFLDATHEFLHACAGTCLRRGRDRQAADRK